LRSRKKLDSGPQKRGAKARKAEKTGGEKASCRRGGEQKNLKDKGQRKRAKSLKGESSGFNMAPKCEEKRAPPGEGSHRGSGGPRVHRSQIHNRGA